LALIVSLVLIVLGSVLLFAVIQSGILGIAIAAFREEFYTPVPNASDSITGRFLGVFALLQAAVWPIVAFLVLLTGATCAISALLPFEGRFAPLRRWATGAGYHS
jgi:hypothetical protein